MIYCTFFSIQEFILKYFDVSIYSIAMIFFPHHESIVGISSHSHEVKSHVITIKYFIVKNKHLKASHFIRFYFFTFTSAPHFLMLSCVNARLAIAFETSRGRQERWKNIKEHIRDVKIVIVALLLSHFIQYQAEGFIILMTLIHSHESDKNLRWGWLLFH